jgi:N-acetylneuraminic acid mutarotase
MATTDLYRFDPSDPGDPFKVLAPMPGPDRQNAFSFVLGNRLFLGMGNQTDELIVLPDVCYYDVETGFWSLVREPFPGKPRTNAIAFVLNGRAYFGGGADADGNPLDDMWTYTPPTN